MDNLVRDVHIERYYPPVLSPAKEFKAIAEVVNPEMNLLWQRIWQLFCNTFVYDIDEIGASRWESMLKLRPKASDSLEIRQARILAKINSLLPYTQRKLEEILSGICGDGRSSINLDYNNYLLNIALDTTVNSKLSVVIATLKPIVPANLITQYKTRQECQGNIYFGSMGSVGSKVKIKPVLKYQPRIDTALFVGNARHIAKKTIILPNTFKLTIDNSLVYKGAAGYIATKIKINAIIPQITIDNSLNYIGMVTSSGKKITIKQEV